MKTISDETFYFIPQCGYDLWLYGCITSFSVLRMKLSSDVFTLV